MEKIDVLFIAVIIFGAISFFAIGWCVRLHAIIYDIYDVLNNHKEALNTTTDVMKQFNDFTKNQNAFNDCVKDMFDKVNRRNSSTGGRRSEAEAL